MRIRNRLTHLVAFAAATVTPLLLLSPAQAQDENTVSARGVIQSTSNVVYANQTGVKLQILNIVEEGTRVSENELLIQFDESPFDSEREAARAEGISAETGLIIARGRAEAKIVQAEAHIRAIQGEIDLIRMQKETAAIDTELGLEIKRLERQMSYQERRIDILTKMLEDPDIERADRGALELEILESRNEWEDAQEMIAYIGQTLIPQRKEEMDHQLLEAQLKLEVAKLEREVAADERSAAMAASEAQLDAARARLEMIELKLSRCNVVAEADGMVLYAENLKKRGGGLEGAVILPNQIVMKISDLQQMQLSVEVNLRQAQLLEPGMPASVKVEAFPDQVFAGSVSSISEVTTANQTVGVTVKIETEAASLRPGMTGIVTIPLER